ncbi:ATPase-activating ribosome biosynthesis protein [Balamuthia mandrillaris]
MRIEKCWFCGGPVYPGHGISFVRNDSKVFRFCRSKCHKNFKMKRNPRKVRWTKAYRRAAGKEMVLDSTLEFEKRRNRPVKYDRDLVATTVKAMKVVQDVKDRRQKSFYRDHMKGKKQEELKAQLKDLQKSRELLPSPAVLAANRTAATTSPMAVKVKASPSAAKQKQSSGGGSSSSMNLE